jgi:hypothetical protein
MKSSYNIFTVLDIEKVFIDNQEASIEQNYKTAIIFFYFQFLKSRLEVEKFSGRVFAEYESGVTFSGRVNPFECSTDILRLYFPHEINPKEFSQWASLIPSSTVETDTVVLNGENQGNFLVLDIKNPQFFFLQKTHLSSRYYKYFFYLFFVLFLFTAWLLLQTTWK